MNKGIAIKTMCSVALALLFVITAALLISFIFPHSTKSDCMKGQRLHIEKINSTANEVKVTGFTMRTKFKVESCVECMWYEDPLKLKIRWVGMSETEDPVGIGVSVPWSGIGGDCETGLEGGSSCIFTIDVNMVDADC